MVMSHDGDEHKIPISENRNMLQSHLDDTQIKVIDETVKKNNAESNLDEQTGKPNNETSTVSHNIKKMQFCSAISRKKLLIIYIDFNCTFSFFYRTLWLFPPKKKW